MLHSLKTILLTISTRLHLWFNRQWPLIQMERLWICSPSLPPTTTSSTYGKNSSKKNPSSYTILINPNSNWHQQTNPFTTQFKDTHVITYIPPNTLQYHTPLAPPHDKQTHIENLAIQILCIHHKPTILGDISTIQQLHGLLPNMPIHIQIAPPTLPNTKV
jgi:hypothetical protein